MCAVTENYFQYARISPKPDRIAARAIQRIGVSFSALGNIQSVTISVSNWFIGFLDLSASEGIRSGVKVRLQLPTQDWLYHRCCAAFSIERMGLMVWAMYYRPRPDSYPLGEVAEGNDGELVLVDPSSDGGIGLAGGSQSSSGRRVKPESVPKVIRWKSMRKLLDYETTCRRTVSDRFRTLIEEIEPGIHQFEPVQFVRKDGTDLGGRWFWQVCNRIDSVHRGLTNLTLLSDVVWSPAEVSQPRMGFSMDVIGNIKFWQDKHLLGGPYLSDGTKAKIESAEMTGVHFKHYEQA